MTSQKIYSVIKTIFIYLIWLIFSQAVPKLNSFLTTLTYGKIISDTFAIILVLLMFYFIHKKQALLSIAENNKPKTLNFTSLILSICFGLSFVISLAVHWKMDGKLLITHQLGNNNWLFLLLSAVFMEFLFRGIIPNLFKNNLAKFLISTGLFSISLLPFDKNTILSAFLIGSFLYLICWFSHSLFPSIIAHFIIMSNFSLSNISLFFITVLLIMFTFLNTFQLDKNDTNQEAN